MTDAPPLYWYKSVNIEEIEDICSVEFSRTSLPPMEIVSWDKEFMYLRNRMGLIFTTPFDPFFDYLNWTRGFQGAKTGVCIPPIMRLAVLNSPPPFSAESVKDGMFFQNYGLVCWGIKHIIECLLLRTKVVR
jgi:hypothetical protein